MKSFKKGIVVGIFLVNVSMHCAFTSQNQVENKQLLHAELQVVFYDFKQALVQNDIEEIKAIIQKYPTAPNVPIGIRPLAQAIAMGHNQAVDLLVAAGADIKSKDFISGDSLLHTAAHYGNLYAVNELIKKGLSVTTKNKNGQIPLHIALQAENAQDETKENFDLIDSLLNKAPESINAQDEFGATILHYAVIRNNFPLVCQCIQNNIDIHIKDKAGLTALQYAILYRNIDAFEKLYDLMSIKPYNYCDKSLLKKLLRPNIQYDLDSTKHELKSECRQGELNKLLFQAVCDVEIINAALAAGANVNALNEINWTPLHIASCTGYTQTVQALIAAGADVNALDKNNWTPLHIASRNGNTQTVQALIAVGANVNALDKNNWTPLYVASRNGNTQTVEALIAAGADVNALNANNWTPLHIASCYGNTQTVEALIAAGAHINALDKDNLTPLYVASCTRNENTQTVQALIAAGADVNALNANNWTPLHIASCYGYTQIAQMLIAAGAHINALDKDNWTPLYVACRNGYTQIVQALIAAGAEVLGKHKEVNVV
ncbi:MAG TPA: ankyrin repeat domain-containing protein [Candidatus Saccharimonadales bacterium]|nr:ankyrin repeat domain-containing protein [Candidatus Saccharimonadales bacterium]